MKLYATVLSERAKKGQGGNKDILVVLTAEIDGERQEIASMSVVLHQTTGNYIFRATMPDHSKIEEVIKGKKQKDECVSMMHNEDIKTHGHCLECQYTK